MNPKATEVAVPGGADVMVEGAGDYDTGPVAEGDAGDYDTSPVDSDSELFGDSDVDIASPPAVALFDSAVGKKDHPPEREEEDQIAMGQAKEAIRSKLFRYMKYTKDKEFLHTKELRHKVMTKFLQQRVGSVSERRLWPKVRGCICKTLSIRRATVTDSMQRKTNSEWDMTVCFVSWCLH